MTGAILHNGHGNEETVAQLRCILMVMQAMDSC